MISKITDFLKKYSHGFWILAYMIFYLTGFAILENAGHRHYHIIHSFIDDMIPFCEFFVIPYFLWFAYCFLGILWFIFKCEDRREYDQLVSALAIGMTVFLVVSCIFPNAQDLRPTVFARDNIFVTMVKGLYATDTATNVLPSIHVYNSVILFLAFNSCRQLRKKKVLRASIGVLTVLIVLSTMFLKQHSVVDVSLGLLMSAAVQMFCERVFRGEEAGYRRENVTRV